MSVQAMQTSRQNIKPITRNLIANFGGTVWQVLMGIVFIPVYIRFLGIESWGLIGIFATLQIILGLLDMGLSGTVNREMARLSVLRDREQEMRNLVRTLEALYWIIALFVGLILIVASPFIARHWINVSALPVSVVEDAIISMGIITAFQMPVGFYSSGLMGLQKQVLLNGLNIAMNTLRGAGAVLVLWLISSTIQSYFLWQILISVINVALLALILWKTMPVSGQKAVFQKKLLNGIWKFAAGMSSITILSVILTQLDKIILSRTLSLEMFGYYMLASTVAISIQRIVSPVFLSIYPKFTQLFSVDDQEGLAFFYHKTSQLLALLVIPATAVIAFFSYEIVFLWTQNPVTAEKTHAILSVLICGSALNGLLHPPYALQLACGWTKLSVVKNVIAVIILVPLIIILTLQYGAIGAAVAWLVLNIGYLVFEIPVMHRKILRLEKWNWYWRDVTVPVIASAVVAGIGRLLLQQGASQTTMVFFLGGISAATLSVTLFTLPVLRVKIIDLYRKYILKRSTA